MTVDELAVRDVELHPNDTTKINVNGIEELAADKGYRHDAVSTGVKSREVRSYIPEKKQKGRATGRVSAKSNKRCIETGGVRRTYLRGHGNFLQRQLIHVGGLNLSLVIRNPLSAGTTREPRNRFGHVYYAFSYGSCNGKDRTIFIGALSSCATNYAARITDNQLLALRAVNASRM
jgi:hypothetical protein